MDVAPDVEGGGIVAPPGGGGDGTRRSKRGLLTLQKRPTNGALVPSMEEEMEHEEAPGFQNLCCVLPSLFVFKRALYLLPIGHMHPPPHRTHVGVT